MLSPHVQSYCILMEFLLGNVLVIFACFFFVDAKLWLNVILIVLRNKIVLLFTLCHIQFGYGTLYKSSNW